MNTLARNSIYFFIIQIDFQPIKGTKLKQILLSSCHYGANKEPTLELSLRQLDPQKGNLTLKLFPSNEGFFQHDMPYSVSTLFTDHQIKILIFFYLFLNQTQGFRFIIYKVMKYRKILIKYNAYLKRSCISQS